MQFTKFANYLQQLENIAARLKMTELLAELFQELSSEEIIQACYLMQGKLVPLYESLEFGLSEKMILRALARILVQQTHPGANLFGEVDPATAEAEVKKIYKKLGDLGLTIEQIKNSVNKNQTSHLSIIEVFTKLTEIAQQGGEGSQERKIQSLVQLIKVLDSASAKFVARIILGKMRLGFSQMTMIDALSWAVLGNKNEHDILEEAYNRKADIGRLAQFYLTLKNESVANRTNKLLTIQAEVGVPVIPALCQRLNSADEIMEKMGQVYVEPKYDGMRVQIHFQRSDNPASHLIRAFTRNLEDVSHMFPELQKISELANCTSCVLDAEAIGFDQQTGKLLAFQQTITRRRKHGVAEKAQELPIKFFVFDVLEIDGNSLIDQSLQDRKAILSRLFKANSIFNPTPFIITNSVAQWHQYHAQQLGAGLEGVVSKQLDSPYRGGRKGWHWVKTKEEEGTSGKLSDTLDLVVMGYFKGTGRRTEFEIGALLCGVVDDTGQIKTISKVGSGLSEENSLTLLQAIKPLRVATQPAEYIVSKLQLPDVWILPQLVVEVAADEITDSPIHTAKVALRFPRFLKIRTDKSTNQATTLTEIMQLKQLVH